MKGQMKNLVIMNVVTVLGNFQVVRGSVLMGRVFLDITEQLLQMKMLGHRIVVCLICPLELNFLKDLSVFQMVLGDWMRDIFYVQERTMPNMGVAMMKNQRLLVVVHGYVI